MSEFNIDEYNVEVILKIWEQHGGENVLSS